jgi:transitional endoplasmic reticulum ATPase
MSEVVGNPSEVILGRVARVVAIEADGRTFHARLQGGGAVRVSSTAFVTVGVGDNVLVGDAGWQSIPDDVWIDERTVGVVRLLEKDGVLLESALGLRFLRRKPNKKLKLAAGNTVEFDDFGGVVRVISESPIRVRDVGVDVEDVLRDYLLERDEENGPTFDQFGGYPEVVARARELIETQLERREELKSIRARPVKGVIFTGPPGTGKTHLARIIAHESGADFFLVSGPSIVSKWMGDSEDTLRKIFDAAAASKRKRAIIFFDEIDSIAESRSGDSHEASKRLVAQLLTLLDGFESSAGEVIVIAATNRVDDIDEALLRPGRFDWEIEFGLPTAADRYEILRVSARRVNTVGDLPLEEIAQLSDGWSAARLTSVWTEAALFAASDRRGAIAGEDLAQAFERVSSRPLRSRKGAGNVNS